MTTTAQTIPATTIATLEALEQRILWLASYMIHNANHIRENRDGLKVGGHQASSASMTTLMTVLYFHVLKPHDRVAVKPHASPVFHAIQNLMGREDIAQLQNFRSLGGAQSYPSRTKDKADVDFSTGSVGLGVAITAFASLVQDWLAARDKVGADKMGRFISLLGDAELDEGNIYEALIEAAKHDIRNTWWIVDYNRQSLDACTPERMFARFDEIFRACGWQVDVLKYGAKLSAAFKQPGGTALFHWLEACPNDLYAVLSYGDGAGWRAQLTADIGTEKGVDALLKAHDDASLAALMTNLGGHCFETLLRAFDVASQSDAPRFMLAYTIKGRGLPFQGHKDNHAGLMNPTQVAELQKRLGVPEGAEWDALSGLSPETKQAVVAAIETAPFMAPANRRPTAPQVAIPAEIFTAPEGDKQATQAAFGKVMFEIAKSDSDFASRVITTSPDVTVSTNIGPFVNRRGIFHRSAQRDMFKDRKIASAQAWTMGADGQHIELGIAESNLFLMLCALGMSADLFGERLFPVGTLYDPFIARGLDQLNYACYQNARFLLGSTPSGITLAAEGGAHQSINTPLIGMAQPGLTSFEPAFVDELALMMHWGFEHMQAADGGATYLRLSTRAIAQAKRSDDAWKADALKGAYWLRAPQGPCPLVIAYCGAVAPEAIAAFEAVLEDEPNAGLLAITSPGVLHADWTRAGRARWTGESTLRSSRGLTAGPSATSSHIADLLTPLTPHAGIVTLIDGAPSALSWLGGVHGHKVRALGVEVFGQSGDQIDLYAKYRLDVEAVLDAVADVMV
jgi:pyruvate dehydrogenase E1 component